MKRLIVTLSAVAVLTAATAWAKDPDQKGKDEAAIRKAVASYVDAFNRGDARALASQWSDDGEYLSSSGERIQGRKSIEEAFEAFFAENAGTRIEVSSPSVRLATTEVAIEEGTARAVEPGEAPTESSYIAVHVKQGGRWLLHSVRETELPSPPSHYDQLSELEWLIGRWVDQDENATIDMECKWTKNKNFITRSFTATIAEHVELEGTQVIGWDPAAGTIRSWLFDSDGGFAEATWTRQGDQWTIRARHVLPDGEIGSSSNILTYVDHNSFTWTSVGREVAGQMLPNVDEVTVVRAGTEK